MVLTAQVLLCCASCPLCNTFWGLISSRVALVHAPGRTCAVCVDLMEHDMELMILSTLPFTSHHLAVLWNSPCVHSSCANLNSAGCIGREQSGFGPQFTKVGISFCNPLDALPHHSLPSSSQDERPLWLNSFAVGNLLKFFTCRGMSGIKGITCRAENNSSRWIEFQAESQPVNNKEERVFLQFLHLSVTYWFTCLYRESTFQDRQWFCMLL